MWIIYTHYIFKILGSYGAGVNYAASVAAVNYASAAPVAGVNYAAAAPVAAYQYASNLPVTGKY